MPTDYARSLRDLADSQTRRLSPGDLERGPVYAVHACQSVAAALAEYIRADHRCDVSEQLARMASAERDHDESETDAERADALQAWSEHRADTLAAIAEQRLAWGRIVDIARVALIMLDEAQGDVIADSVGEAAQ